jgi:mRNA interferase MazF
VTAPNRGDLVWIDFDPQAGREQAGRRPALVLTPRGYHQRSSFAIVCPVTSKPIVYPFAVPLPAGLRVSGFVLADQVKSVDRNTRRIEPAGKAPESVVEEVMATLMALLPFAGP